MEKRNYSKIANRVGVEETNEVLDMVQDTFSPPTDSDNMIFNKNYYKAKKEVSSLKKFFVVCPLWPLPNLFNLTD